MNVCINQIVQNQYWDDSCVERGFFGCYLGWIMCTHVCKVPLVTRGLLSEMNHVYRTHVCKDPLVARGLLSEMSHVHRTHVCTDALVARVTIGRKGAPFRMSHVYTCVRFWRTPCTHVYTEDPSTARGRHSGWIMCTVHMCTRILWLLGLLFRMSHNFGGPPVHMCTISEDPLYTCVQFRRTPCTHVYNFGGPPLGR